MLAVRPWTRLPRSSQGVLRIMKYAKANTSNEYAEILLKDPLSTNLKAV